MILLILGGSCRLDTQKPDSLAVMTGNTAAAPFCWRKKYCNNSNICNSLPEVDCSAFFPTRSVQKCFYFLSRDSQKPPLTAVNTLMKPLCDLWTK